MRDAAQRDQRQSRVLPSRVDTLTLPLTRAQSGQLVWVPWHTGKYLHLQVSRELIRCRQRKNQTDDHVKGIHLESTDHIFDFVNPWNPSQRVLRNVLK